MTILIQHMLIFFFCNCHQVGHTHAHAKKFYYLCKEKLHCLSTNVASRPWPVLIGLQGKKRTVRIILFLARHGIAIKSISCQAVLINANTSIPRNKLGADQIWTAHIWCFISPCTMGNSQPIGFISDAIDSLHRVNEARTWAPLARHVRPHI
jgi:hypothetical protein